MQTSASRPDAAPSPEVVPVFDEEFGEPFGEGNGEVRGRVRSYAARRGRLSALTRERMERLFPAHSLPEGVLDPARAFGREAPVVLEVGCGHGAAALAYAEAHLGHDLVAVDVFTPALARMLAEAERRDLTNLWVHQGDAVLLLEQRIPVATLAAVHLFFPDPWPKAKHSKRRFLARHTLDLIASRLVLGGHLLVATDHPVYAEHARAELAADERFVVTEGERPSWRPTDGFEAKGLTAGRTTTEFRAELRGWLHPASPPTASASSAVRRGSRI